MIEYIFSGIFGGLIGAATVLFISNNERKQHYYIDFVKSISEHNWKLLENKIDPGLKVTNINLEKRVVCYQHLNIFLLAWLNKKIIIKDKSLSGWKNWAKNIVEGAKIERNKDFSYAYRDILTDGDLYPEDFIKWLKTDMELSADKFDGPTNREFD